MFTRYMRCVNKVMRLKNLDLNSVFCMAQCMSRKQKISSNLSTDLEVIFFSLISNWYTKNLNTDYGFKNS